MTQFIEPNRESDLTGPKVLDRLQSLRTGLLSGFLVSAGSSGFLINIASGRLVNAGTTIYDDATRNDSTILSSALSAPLGANTHALVYAQYAYQDTFPPAAMTFDVSVTTGSPPASPSLPADSVKLADIFIASGESDLSNAQIINSPKVPDLGNADGDVLIERLVNSNLNVFIDGGGDISYDSGTDIVTWTSDIVVRSMTVTHQEKYLSAPLAIGEIAAGTIGSVGDNAIVFTVFDRSTVTEPLSSPQTLTMHVLDLDNPDPAERNLFYNPGTREQIVWLAMTVGGTLVQRAGLGTGLPAPSAAAPPYLFLQHDPLGGTAHAWAPITEDLIVSILSISSLAITTPSSGITELGDNVVTPQLSATTINDGGDGPTTATLTNDDNVESKDVVSGFGGTSSGTFQSDQSYQKSATGANGQVVFTLTADDGNTPDAETVNLNWYRYTYWGFEASDPGSGNYDNTFLKTTIQADQGGQSLRSGRGVTISEPAPASAKYFYFAFPAWKGAVTSIIDNNTGFEVLSAFTQVDAAQAGITTENAAAIAENYRVYRSNSLQTGAINITVS